MSGTQFANQRLVTCSPADSPANREPFASRCSQSDARYIPRDSCSQSESGCAISLYGPNVVALVCEDVRGFAGKSENKLRAQLRICIIRPENINPSLAAQRQKSSTMDAKYRIPCRYKCCPLQCPAVSRSRYCRARELACHDGHGGRAISTLPAGSPDFRKWESCRTMPLVGGFSRGPPVSRALSFRRYSTFTSIALVSSQDLADKSRPNLFTHSVKLCLHEAEEYRGNGLCVPGRRGLGWVAWLLRDCEQGEGRGSNVLFWVAAGGEPRRRSGKADEFSCLRGASSAKPVTLQPLLSLARWGGGEGVVDLHSFCPRVLLRRPPEVNAASSAPDLQTNGGALGAVFRAAPTGRFRVSHPLVHSHHKHLVVSRSPIVVRPLHRFPFPALSQEASTKTTDSPAVGRRPSPRSFSKCHVAPKVLVSRIFLRNIYTCRLLQQGGRRGCDVSYVTAVTHSLAARWGRGMTRQRAGLPRGRGGSRLNFTALYALESASFLNWLLRKREASPFLIELLVNTLARKQGVRKGCTVQGINRFVEMMTCNGMRTLAEQRKSCFYYLGTIDRKASRQQEDMRGCNTRASLAGLTPSHPFTTRITRPPLYRTSLRARTQLGGLRHKSAGRRAAAVHIGSYAVAQTEAERRDSLSAAVNHLRASQKKRSNKAASVSARGRFEVGHSGQRVTGAGGRSQLQPGVTNRRVPRPLLSTRQLPLVLRAYGPPIIALPSIASSYGSTTAYNGKGRTTSPVTRSNTCCVWLPDDSSGELSDTHEHFITLMLLLKTSKVTQNGPSPERSTVDGERGKQLALVRARAPYNGDVRLRSFRQPSRGRKFGSVNGVAVPLMWIHPLPGWLREVLGTDLASDWLQLGCLLACAAV
ncbi:hypothetical protein PR048_032732 [Dryococelus australis]|uniref:Uncharacterized protein n=1 Tax=Dryococelus australis TaxID=614101 RepID=A0ABQ9G317_9NEOP|nr:hypothetical protein PR048_032732 [Dryococelus australis]